MAQTVVSTTIYGGQQIILIKKPRVLRRIFFSVRVLADPGSWYHSKMSLGDPLFRTFYMLDGPATYFEARGEGIFQGDVWVRNTSAANLMYATSEILVG